MFRVPKKTVYLSDVSSDKVTANTDNAISRPL